MKVKRSLKRLIHSFFVAAALASATEALAQSSDQNYPTPITTSEIRGTIRARDIGDSRLTTHFYAFDGSQGDIFVNVQSKNFDGDIDIFTTDGLRSLARIVLYSDAGISETGRIVYLRKGERLLLRIQGRSPDDFPAAYTIKFAGSFVALEPDRRNGNPGVPKVSGDDAEGARLNSIGSVVERNGEKPPPVSAPNNLPESSSKTDRSAVVKPVAKRPETTSSRGTSENIVPSRSPVKVPKPKPPASTTKAEVVAVLDPLASIRLTIELKSGELYERSMSDVLRFSTDKGMVTVISKDGKIVRYLITDIAKVTIQ
ncbi:MAG: hypothetical protein ABJA02_12605 [Acidobacteriota bacterium]